VRLAGLRKADSRGLVKRLGCVKAEAATPTGAGCGCKWQVAYEEATQGWFLKSWSRHSHEHALELSAVQSMARGSGRQIPDAFVEQGNLLASAGQPAKEIMKVFSEMVEQRGVEVSWNYKDVYDQFVPSVLAKALDIQQTWSPIWNSVVRRGYSTT
jgi:hypothetical protein